MWLPGIRLARAADALAIADMSREYIEYGLGWSWTTARIAAAIQDEATNVAVVHLSGDLIAFGIMHYGDRTAHLALLAVHPMQRKRGIGCVEPSRLLRSGGGALGFTAARTRGFAIRLDPYDLRADGPEIGCSFTEKRHNPRCSDNDQRTLKMPSQRVPLLIETLQRLTPSRFPGREIRRTARDDCCNPYRAHLRTRGQVQQNA